jgi:hypothetical protein
VWRTQPVRLHQASGRDGGMVDAGHGRVARGAGAGWASGNKLHRLAGLDDYLQRRADDGAPRRPNRLKMSMMVQV